MGMIGLFVGWVIVDGWGWMIESVVSIDMRRMLWVMYVGFVGRIVGYGMWGRLVGGYERWGVGGLWLVVGVVGVGSGGVLLDEGLRGVEFLGGVVIMRGVYMNVFGLGWGKGVKVRG